jgi:hypothetical protein
MSELQVKLRRTLMISLIPLALLEMYPQPRKILPCRLLDPSFPLLLALLEYLGLPIPVLSPMSVGGGVGGPSRELSSGRAPTPAEDSGSASAAFVLKHELEELRIKVRILEGRKTEDHDRIRTLETKAAEADMLKAARVKLQGELVSAPFSSV